MKKIITLLIMLFFMAGGILAATVQVGSGTATSVYLPIRAYYGYTYSQQIYTQAQIATAGNITQLRFYLSTGNPISNSNAWVVYLGYTSKTTFASATDWEPVANLTQVFSGNVTFPADGSWMEITLTTPFEYNNVDNLIVAVDENTPSYADDDVYWASFTSGANTGIYYYSDVTNPNPASPPTGILTSNINQIQFEILPATGPSNPTSFAATPVSTSQIDLGWVLNGNGNPVMLVWNSTNTFGTPVDGTPYGVGVTIPGGGTVLQNNTNTSYSHTPLSSNTPYFYKAFSVDGFTAYSPGVSANATTFCDIFTVIIEDFELATFPPDCWSLVTGSGDWTRTTLASGFGSGVASAFAGFYSISGSTPFDLISPEFNASNAVVTFDHAYATYITEVDQLIILYSTDGGSNYTPLVTLDGGVAGPLNTGGATTSPFAPTSAQWATKSYPLPAGTNKVKFQAVSAFGNNLYLDNIYIWEPPTIDLRLSQFYQSSGLPVPGNEEYGMNIYPGGEAMMAHERHDFLNVLPSDVSGVPESEENYTIIISDPNRSTFSIMLADIQVTAEIENLAVDPVSYILNWEVDGVPQVPYNGPVVNPGIPDIANLLYPSPPERGTFLATGTIDVVGDEVPGNNSNEFRMRVYPDVFGRTIYDRGDNDVDTYVGWNNPTIAMKAGVRFTAGDYIKPVGVDFICRTEEVLTGTYTIEIRAAGATDQAPGAVLYTVQYTDPVFFPAAGDYLHFAFDENLVPTIAIGSDYWITIECPLGVLYPGAAQTTGITPGRSFFYVASSDIWTALVLDLVEYAWVMRSVHVQGEIPECPVPTNLSASNVSTQGADLDWDYAVDSFFDIFVDISGGPVPGPGTVPTASGVPVSSYTWTGGTPNTNYSWWVRSDCGFLNPDIDYFWMAMTGGILDPALSGGTFDLAENEDGIWYNYTQSPDEIDWWNVWFYNDPLDLTRMKKIKMGFWVQPLNPGPANIYYVVNWSNDQWTGTGFPTPADEAYIERSPVNGPVEVQPGMQWIELSYIIPDYNPEWVSVDIWGDNIQILQESIIPPPSSSQLSQYWVPGSPGGIIVHECLAKPSGNNSEWQGPSTFRTMATNPTPCDLGLAIPDAGCASNNYLEVSVLVSDAPGTQLGIDVLFSSVSLIIDHTWDSDLDIYLLSPGGIQVELSTDNGSSGDDYGDPLNCPASVTTFIMDAATSITTGIAPFIGSYIPEGDLDAFHDGSNPNGIWTLLVCDDTGGDIGTVEYLALEFVEPPTCPVPLNLTTLNITASSAQLSFDIPAGPPDSFFDVFYALDGIAPGGSEGTTISGVLPPVTIEDLEENTNYNWFARSVCGLDQPDLEHFWLAIDETSQLVPGSSGGSTEVPDPGEDLTWYQYTDESANLWYNIWFYNDPFDATRMKIIKMGFWVQRLNPALAGNIFYVVNWSTPDWNPPLPAFPMPVDEAYVDRSPTNGPYPVIAADIDNPYGQWIELTYVLPDFNPAWVSVDIWGDNITILNLAIEPPMESSLHHWWLQSPLPGGILVHECLPKPSGNSSPWEGPVLFTTLPQCPAPTDLLTTGITENSAILNWNGPVDSFFDVFYNPGSDPFEGTIIWSVNSPLEINGLEAGTDYSWAVRTDCGFDAPKVDNFWMAMDEPGNLLEPFSGGTADELPEGETGQWYFYDQAPGDFDWWNIWFYNDPFDATRMKKIRMGFWVNTFGPGPGTINYVVNWSTPEWIGPGFPTPLDEAFIQRSPVNGPVTIDLGIPQWIELYFIIPDYNPEWVSVDIWGENIIIEQIPIQPPEGSPLRDWWNPTMPGGMIVHECLPKTGGPTSSWSAPVLFSTLCGTYDIPYTQNFDTEITPAIPNCMSVTNDNADAYSWVTSTSYPRSAPNSMYIYYNSSLAMDDWFFTPPLSLDAGNYLVSFWYRGNGFYPEALEVKWGTAPNAAGMTNGPIFDNNNILTATYEKGTGIMTVPVAGDYYVGWHGYSDLDMFYMVVDDIAIQAQYTWTGTLSNAWNNPGNWSTGVVPDLNVLVIIPTAPTGGNFPVVGAGIVGNCYDVVLEPGATLTVEDGGTLNVLNATP